VGGTLNPAQRDNYNIFRQSPIFRQDKTPIMCNIARPDPIFFADKLICLSVGTRRGVFLVNHVNIPNLMNTPRRVPTRLIITDTLRFMRNMFMHKSLTNTKFAKVLL